MFNFAWLVLALPAVSALIILFFGKRIGDRATAFMASGAVALAFVVGVALYLGMVQLPEEAREITVPLWNWITVGAFEVGASLLLDPLSLTMVLIVTGVGALIHFYSIAYMEGDERYQRFFLYLNFFIFAMLVLVLGDNFLVMFVGWEGVGLASFLLIGFWFDRRDDSYGYYADAGKKAFLVNRVGDFGMIVAMLMIWATLGTLNFVEVSELAEHGSLAVGTANFICLMLLLAAAGKSAQIPLYVWLPDAMAGPTPVSALIHAATMVTAGIYMITRTHALWHIAESAALTAAWVGGLTALFAATLALVQVDLKKILAYSTISQLGYMMLGVGVAAYGASIFHLTTHAFFKAVLFLGAGSVMHALHGELDIRKMGGLRAKMPATFWTFLIGSFALAGIFPLAGFFSKDGILLGALTHGNVGLYIVGLLTALLTAIYAGRALFLVFTGKPRDQHLFDHAHESPRLMTIPLWILAALAALAGIVNLPFVLTFEEWLTPVLGEHTEPSLQLELLVLVLSLVVAVFGMLVAWARYDRGEGWSLRLGESFAFMQPALERKWYVDEIYDRVIIQPLRAVSAWFATFVDKGIIDGAVNGIGWISLWLGAWARKLETGAVPTYALSILIGVVVLLAYFFWSA
jgi:NADH-quinone oxidoreductase subunit L